MRVSVALCTWNRAPLLRRALASLAALEIPRDVEIEILVVDNGSTRRHARRAARARGRAPPARAARAGARPLPRAQSRGRGGARRLDPLDRRRRAGRAGLARGLRRRRSLRHPEASFFGGATLPFPEQPPPDWIAASWEQLADVWAIRTLPPAPAPIRSERLPVGANFAIRAEAQRRHRYDPRLGRRRDALVGGEETAVMRAAARRRTTRAGGCQTRACVTASLPSA